MKLTKDHISGDKYKAIFTNFQEEYCWYENINKDRVSGDSLFSDEGSWEFFDGTYGDCTEELDEKEGVRLRIKFNHEYEYVGNRWKIKMLTNKKIILINEVCHSYICYYKTSRTLTFEKE